MLEEEEHELSSTGRRASKADDTLDFESLESEDDSLTRGMNSESKCATCGHSKFGLLLRPVREGKVDDIVLLLPLLDETHKICTDCWLLNLRKTYNLLPHNK